MLSAPLSKCIIRASSSQPPPFSFSDSTSHGRGTYRPWDKTSMKQAVEKGVSVRKAAELYNVPCSTLHDKANGKTAEDAKSGTQPYLLPEEEELTSFLLQAAKIGYPYTRKQIIALLQQIVHDKGITTTVTNWWWERFLKTSAINFLSCSTTFICQSNGIWPRSYWSILWYVGRLFAISNGLLNKAPCIFNCDEKGVPLDPKCMKIVDKVG